MIRPSNALFDDLEKVSSYDRQRYEWIDNEEGIVSSYVEDYYGMFWDTGLMDKYERVSLIFGPKIDDAIKNLHAMMAAIDGYKYTEEEILNMPEMVVIREEAARILKMLKEPNPNEGLTFQWISPGEKR